MYVSPSSPSLASIHLCRASHLKFERVEKREYCWRRHSQGESALTRSLLDSAVLTPNYISVLLPPCQSSDSRKVERQRVVRLEVPLMQPFTVQHAIEKLVTTYGIKGRVSDFDLRCVDVASCFGSDGDGDGNEGGDWAGMRLEPDLDLPPLELATDVRKFDVDVLALCSHATAAAAASLMCGGQSEFGAASRLLKVRMPGGDCHVLSLDDADIYLSDVLRRLSKKRLKALDPEEFTFHYPRNGARSAPPLDLGMRIDDLDVLSLHLRRLDAEMVVLPSSLSPGGRDGRCEPANFVFSDESASVYKEWIVYKKNRWGRKQQRRLGIDRSTIYNNSDTRQVKRVARSISDLIDVKLVAGRPKCFEMLFRNQAEVITVSYQALNEFDCAEIVARLNYIRRM